MKKSLFAFVMAVVIGFMTAVALCVKSLSAPVPVFSATDASMKIVLDAGHGGMDGGVTGKKTGVKESDLNLAITFKLKDVLEDMGFEVTLTRKTSSGLYDTATKGFKKRDMQKRKEIIEEAEPALVISVHQNLFPSFSTRGAQVFYAKENEGSGKLAQAVQSTLNALYQTQGVKDRKEATGDFYMLRCSSAPSIIVECGFLSNAKDEALLVKESWQRKIAESIGAGVVEYFSQSAC
jgi:N-acetylmuramoyl-L-alanine amidase